MSKSIPLFCLFILGTILPFKSYCQGTQSFKQLPYVFPEEGSFELANFNEDSLLDLVVLSKETPYRLSFYKAVNANTFVQEKERALGGVLQSGLEIVDVNEDNRPDVFTLGMAGPDSAAALVFFADSGFNFRPMAIPLDFKSVESYLWCDFNEDGKQDLFISGLSKAENQNRSIIFIQEEGGFRELEANFLQEKITGLVRLAAPIPTFYVFTSSETEEVFPSGLYTFQKGEFTYLETKLPSYGTAVFAQGDLNHDGQWDLFASGVDKDGKKVSGAFLGEEEDYIFIPLDFNEKDLIQAQIVDIDNDGLADIVANFIENGETKAYVSSEGDGFEFSLLPVEGAYLYLSDYDHDGKVDIFASQAEEIAVYQNRSAGQNLAPKAPESFLSLPLKEGLFFTWTQGKDDKTPSSSLSYDIMVKGAEDSVYYNSSLVNVETGYDKFFGYGSQGTALISQLKGDLSDSIEIYHSTFDNAHFTGPNSLKIFKAVGDGICYLSSCIEVQEKDTLLCEPTAVKLNSFFETDARYWVSYSNGYLGKDDVPHVLQQTDILYGISIINDCIELLIVNLKIPEAGPFVFNLEACKNDTLRLHSETGADTFYWYNLKGDSLGTEPELSYLAQTSDTVLLHRDAAISACSQIDTFYIEVYPLPGLTVSENKTIRGGEEAWLQAWGAAQYEWFPKEGVNDPFSAATTASPLQTTTYVVKASNATGCIQFDSVQVTVVNDLFVPTLFSPNADGKNDRLQIIGSGIKQLRFAIYDTSGTLVFEANSVEEARRGWDGTYKGKPLPPGNLAWHLQGKFADGSPLQFASRTTGFLTLIR